jgi:pimeloyl-ACP methyl ester carboxylesterase
VLIGWGQQDTWLPLDSGERLAAAIPGARRRVFDNAGHLVMRDAPAQLGTTLADFLHTSARAGTGNP